MIEIAESTRVVTPRGALKRMTLAVAGALLVTLGAQIALPLTPVPITFQVPAVLIVGGLLGPGLGAASLAAYLVMGALGLPVFAPGGAVGAARLFGPTGGYLLAFPLAAAVAGRVIGDARSWLRLGLGLVGGTLVIHAGGVAQLAILGGDLAIAIRAGSLPFLVGDLVKLAVAGLLIRRVGPAMTRARS
ncbi:MAG TPA: biotin transporter BioY [Gemmatimonadales bacterium]